MPVIKSLFDNDLYKFTMQRAVLGYKQGVPVKYVFNNRRPESKFNHEFMKAFRSELDMVGDLRAKDNEISYLAERCPFLGSEYFEYIRNYRYNPKVVTAELSNGELNVEVEGVWEREILWEVPLMSLISELYFTHCDQDWNPSPERQLQKIHDKATRLGDTTFTDFGTRRRRNYETQDMVVREFKKLSPNFVGTSNVHLAHKHNLRPIGTMAHEWIMAISALESLRHANRYATQIWSNIYKGNLGTALPDTFGDVAFWMDFDSVLARLFDGIRHDSGDPFEFTDRTVAGYKNLGIDPLTKFAIFSDGLDVDGVLALRAYCQHKIRCSFGIGTHLTNDFETLDGKVSKALNMVIKMAMCNWIHVVKLSNTLSKAIGDRDALRVAKWTVYNTPLD